MKTTIDARGLSCPEPVIRLRQVIGTADEIELLADNSACVENCTRFAQSMGFRVDAEGSRGEYMLTIRKA